MARPLRREPRSDESRYSEPSRRGPATLPPEEEQLDEDELLAEDEADVQGLHDEWPADEHEVALGEVSAGERGRVAGGPPTDEDLTQEPEDLATHELEQLTETDPPPRDPLGPHDHVLRESARAELEDARVNVDDPEDEVDEGAFEDTQVTDEDRFLRELDDDEAAYVERMRHLGEIPEDAPDNRSSQSRVQKAKERKRQGQRVLGIGVDSPRMKDGRRADLDERWALEEEHERDDRQKSGQKGPPPDTTTPEEDPYR